MTLDGVEKVLDKFAGLFLGGTDKFKATAYYWRELSHKYGKRFHYGRAGTRRKILHAVESGADSADSAFPLWTTERLLQTVGFLVGRNKQGVLWGIEEASTKP